MREMMKAHRAEFEARKARDPVWRPGAWHGYADPEEQPVSRERIAGMGRGAVTARLSGWQE